MAVGALVVAIIAGGCSRRRTGAVVASKGSDAASPQVSAAAPAASGKAAALSLPDWYPPTLDPSLYAGAASCAECHRAIYDAWRASPHGRAMATPSPETVLGRFDGKPLDLAGYVITPARRGASYVMTIAPPAGSGAATTWPVELVLASGRQYQLYLTRGEDGALRPLPLYFSTRARAWVDGGRYRGAVLDPASPNHWLRQEVVSDGECFYCHLSQGRARADGRRVEQAWTDLSVNCESCHGPSRHHGDERRAGRVPPKLPDLRDLDKHEEALLCGRCHATQATLHDDRRRDIIPVTLADKHSFRPDATQLGTAYQYAGHVSSGCFNRGALTCSACHDPHRQTPRSLDGEAAEGARSDHQCSVCHRDYLEPAAARRHAHHRATRCVDCHMPRHFVFDEPKARQEVSDHAISIPRPRESTELGLENACARCHADHDAGWLLGALERWGQKKALGVRPWVKAIALGQRGEPGAVDALLPMVSAPDTPRFLRASALNLLGVLPPDPRVAAKVTPLAEDKDFLLRGMALRALWTHDEARREGWLSGVISDPDARVRLFTTAAAGPAPFSEGQLDQLMADVLRYSTVPPTVPLLPLILHHATAGRFARALAICDALLAHSTPRQIEASDLRTLRERLVAAQAQTP